MYICICFF